ncbi:hypothetical protein ACQ4PT_028567 [Festuca glaucescens]
MGNMGQQHLGNATSVPSLLHQLKNMWKSPRGTVLRIEALALLAIFLSFFLAVFGSCRRWSNNFLIQKGFMAANALFLSLGTYSIGLMQSSPVKSEMYPIWAVSLLALLCCVDSAAASGLDNRNQIWKMLYLLCLYFGYVLLMSITTISSDIGNIAICVLSAVTFIKGFHRSMALVLPSSMRNMIREFPGNSITKCSFGDPNEERELTVDDKLDVMIGYREEVKMGDIASMRCEGNNKILESKLNSCKDVCLSFSLSHLLHRRFLGLSSVKPFKASLAQPLYISRELKEMLRGSCTGSTIDLHPDVKASIGDFVENQIKSNEISSWASSKVENGQSGFPDFSFRFTPTDNPAEASDMIYVSCILIWHVATCYCELAQQCDHSNVGGHHVTMEKDHRRVATDLSKYCAYLVASAPRLLPGRSDAIKLFYSQVREDATRVGKGFSYATAGYKLRAMDTKGNEHGVRVHIYGGVDFLGEYIYGLGAKLGKGLQSMDDVERWKVLADFWVKALVYAAPSDKVEEHMHHLSQGGELITHLWAMLYHAGIHMWQLNPPAPNNINMGWDYIFRIRSWKDLKMVR